MARSCAHYSDPSADSRKGALAFAFSRARLNKRSFHFSNQVDAYADYRAQVLESAGRINAMYSSVSRAVLHIVNRSVSRSELSALVTAFPLALALLFLNSRAFSIVLQVVLGERFLFYS